ncbi:MAG: hypothetical protein K2O56_01035 [Muribaculaceae bacterium]|nr:hypothetical protein [Muribaculaceae bacterium]
MINSENGFITATSKKERIVSFLWQHLLLVCSLFIMTLGVAVCVRSNFGSSVISSIPLAMTLAGAEGKAPGLTIGDYTNIMNIVLVFGQILILRRRFEKMQLFQLIIGFLFGFLLDVNMYLTSSVICDTLLTKSAAQLAGCLILGLGIAFEIRCGSVTMPGEGFPAAISKAGGIPFAKAKICVDISLVVIAVILGYAYFGKWLWNVVGPGTLFAMFFVGMVVRVLDKHMGWFDRLLHYRPGFRRYLFGLARYLYSKVNR